MDKRDEAMDKARYSILMRKKQFQIDQRAFLKEQGINQKKFDRRIKEMQDQNFMESHKRI